MSKRLDAIVKADAVIDKGNDHIRKRMSKKGKLKLPKLVEARRWQYLIPDGAFRMQAVYDRILVVQIPEHEGSTFVEGGTIHMPDTTKARKADEASRGVIVSAGLLAMDQLVSNGMDVGHVIRFVRYSPWNIEVDNVEGHAIYDMVLRAGDLVASEDLADALRKGECRIEVVETKDGLQHQYMNKKKQRWRPALPWIADDI